MPAISSGIFGFPKDKCAEILVEEAKNFLVNNNNITSLEIVEFCAIDDETMDYLKREFASTKEMLDVVLANIGDNIAYRHGLHFRCQEVYPYRNQKKV